MNLKLLAVAMSLVVSAFASAGELDGKALLCHSKDWVPRGNPEVRGIKFLPGTRYRMQLIYSPAQNPRWLDTDFVSTYYLKTKEIGLGNSMLLDRKTLELSTQQEKYRYGGYYRCELVSSHARLDQKMASVRAQMQKEEKAEARGNKI